MSKRMCDFVGCGRLGRTIAKLWAQHNSVTLSTIVTRQLETAQQAVQFIGAGSANTSLADLSGDLICIASGDDTIDTIVSDLTAQCDFAPGTIVMHFSGSLPATILAPLRAKGCLIASVHPLRGFADPELSVQNFAGTFCTLEGDAEALAILQPLFEQIGGRCLTINSADKAAYHAASSFAGNFILSLADIAMRMFQDSGMTAADGYAVTHSLMHTVLQNFRGPDLQGVLTGPISRGDFGTVAKHVQAIQESDYAEPYRALASSTMHLANLSAEQRAQLTQLLSQLEVPNVH